MPDKQWFQGLWLIMFLVMLFPPVLTQADLDLSAPCYRLTNKNLAADRRRGYDFACIQNSTSQDKSIKILSFGTFSGAYDEHQRYVARQKMVYRSSYYRIDFRDNGIRDYGPLKAQDPVSMVVSIENNRVIVRIYYGQRSFDRYDGGLGLIPFANVRR